MICWIFGTTISRDWVFFFATRKHCWVQPEGYFKVWGTSKLRDKNRCAYWCQKTCLKPYNNISFQKTISTSQMTSVSNAIFQMKSTEYLVVFCLRKILKNLTLPALTKYYPVLLYNTYKNLRLHEVVYLPLHEFRFYEILTKNVKFPHLVVQIEVQITKNLQGTRKNKFLFPNNKLS